MIESGSLKMFDASHSFNDERAYASHSFLKDRISIEYLPNEIQRLNEQRCWSVWLMRGSYTYTYMIYVFNDDLHNQWRLVACPIYTFSCNWKVLKIVEHEERVSWSRKTFVSKSIKKWMSKVVPSAYVDLMKILKQRFQRDSRVSLCNVRPE